MELEVNEDCVAFLSLPGNFQKSVCIGASDWSRDRCTTNKKNSHTPYDVNIDSLLRRYYPYRPVASKATGIDIFLINYLYFVSMAASAAHG